MKRKRSSVSGRGLCALAAMVCGAAVAHASGPPPAGVGFRINDGRIVPEADYAVKVSILGTAFATKSGTLVPITLRLNVGDVTLEPFGDSDSTSGDVNVADLTTTDHIFPEMIDGARDVTLTGIGWKPSRDVDDRRIRHSSDNDEWVIVLRNGDAVPAIDAFVFQDGIEHYIEPYLSRDKKTVRLHPNQALYLFELGTNSLTSSAADFQDLVLLVTLGESVEDLEDYDYGPVRRYIALPDPVGLYD